MLMKWMLGKLDDEALLAKAREGTDQDVRNQMCEANFYLGEHYFRKGDKEKAAGAVAVRARGNRDLGVMSVDAFIELIANDIATKA